MDKDSGFSSRRAGDPPTEYHHPSDEIDLYDLWFVMLRRVWWIVGVTALCLFSGLIYWQTQEATTRYVTSIEIGKAPSVVGEHTAHPALVGPTLALVEPVSELLTRLQEAALPVLRLELATKHDMTVGEMPEAEFRHADGAFLFIESAVADNQRELAATMHRQLADFTLNTHQALAAPARLRLQSQMASLELELKALEDESTFHLRKLAAKAKLAEAQAKQDQISQVFPREQRNRGREIARLKEQLGETQEAYRIKRQALTHEIRQNTAAADATNELRGRLRDSIKLVAAEQELLTSQLDDLRVWVGSARDLQNRALAQPDNIGGLGALMMGNIAHTAHLEYRQMQLRLEINLPERRAELTGRLEDAGRELTATKERGAELSTVLSKLSSDHGRDEHERAREIERLKDAMALAAEDHQRTVAATARAINRLAVELERLDDDYDRELAAKRQSIAQFQAFVNLMTDTRVAGVFIAEELVGRGGALILALSLVLGGMLGIFTGFVVEFHHNAGQRLRRQREKETPYDV